MDISSYQKRAHTTAVELRIVYNGKDSRWVYPALGIAGEVGELENKLKKILRDRSGEISQSDIVAIKSEIGDVLWYLAELCTTLGLSLDEIAAENLRKLADRMERNKIRGDGDER